LTALADTHSGFVSDDPTPRSTPASDTLTRRLLASGRIVIGGGVFLAMLLACVGTLPFTLGDWFHTAGEPHNALYYDNAGHPIRLVPQLSKVWDWFGTDPQGRSLLGRSLLGGVISLAVGVSAALISIFLGVAVGLVSGYRGGWLDAVLMRIVDILYGLPYILLIILLKIALEPALYRWFSSKPAANMIVLFMAIGLVSWLTMARVVRGQVLALRSLPFIEACRAGGLTEMRIFFRHLLPNLVGPISVYATLTIPQAILQESFLSFLGIGIQPPMPSWGALASDALLPSLSTIHSYWWLLLFPCTLLAITLLSLNFLGDGLRDVFDPKREAAKI
jgi:ABC-type dipeptide/oligopeptide/nickel transport system permease subunit